MHGLTLIVFFFLMIFGLLLFWRKLPLIVRFFILMFGLLLFLGVLNLLRVRKIKKLKYEGAGIVKRTKVSAVKEVYVNKGEDSGYYVYWLESKDKDGNVYRSEEFQDVIYGGRTLEEMVKKYDGVTYDLGNKDEAIRQINDNIHRLEMELQDNPGFLKKMGLKKDIKTMKNYLDIANEGPITPYLIRNGHKISVGDSVNVFVDSDKPEEYYFDLDFTEETKGEF